jgi:hypothetical protein
MNTLVALGRRTPAGAGVIDQDVDGAVVARDRFDQRRHLVRLGEVVDYREGLDAAGREVSLGVLEFRRLARADRNPGAHLTQGFSHLQAEAARAAGDQRHLALELEQLADSHLRRPRTGLPPPGRRRCTW